MWQTLVAMRLWPMLSALGFFGAMLARPVHAQETPDEASPRLECRHTLDVHVVDVYLHEPVGEVQVVLDGRLVVTDGRGHAFFDNLCPGPVTITVVHPAFERLERTVTAGRSKTVELELWPIIETIMVEQKARQAVELGSVASVSGDVLERKRGQSLAEVIADVPGVAQLRSGTGIGKPIVRGQFGRRVPMFVDGVRHRSQDWGIDHAPEIDPAMAERVTVVRGASGVRHGPDALGGALLVTPPAPLQEPGVASEVHMVGYANGLGASGSGRVQVAPALAPGLSLQIDGGGKRLRAPMTPDYALNNTGETEWSGGLVANYLADGVSYQLSLRHFETQLGICTCFRVASASDFYTQLAQRRPIDSALYRSTASIDRPYQAVAHELALLRARFTLAGFGTLVGSYALQYDDRREYDIVRQATTGPQFSFRLLTHDVDLTLEHYPVHVSDNVHLTGAAGVVGMLQSHRYRGLHLVPSHEAVGAGVFISERLWAHDYVIEAGLRYDYLDRGAELLRRDFQRLVRSGQIAQDGCGILTDDTDPVRCNSRFNTVSASLGGLLQVTDAWSAKLDLSTASRPPNPDEQYLNGSAPSLPVVGLGKPDARPETTWAAVANVAFSGSRVRGELAGFANYISGYLYFAPAIGADGQPIFDVLIRGTFPRFTTRAVDAVFYGADGFVTASLLPWLELATQLQVVRARNVTDDSYLVFVPPDRVRGSITATKGSLMGLQKISASLAGSYAARQSRFDPAADLAPPPDAYFLAEAYLGAELPLDDYTVKVGVVGTNLMGTRYREYTSLLRYFADQPGRQLLLRLTMLYGPGRA